MQKFAISEVKFVWGKKILFAINEVRYNRVRTKRVSLSDDKEGPRQGGKILFAITEVRYKRVRYKCILLYINRTHSLVQ